MARAAPRVDDLLNDNMRDAQTSIRDRFPDVQFGETYVGEGRATCDVSGIDCELEDLNGACVYIPAMFSINDGLLQVEVGKSVRPRKGLFYYKIALVWVSFALLSLLVTRYIYNEGKLW